MTATVSPIVVSLEEMSSKPFSKTPLAEPTQPMDFTELKEKLESRGWCFVSLPSQLIEPIQSCLDSGQKFFTSTSKSNKEIFSFSPRFGYFSTDSKEGFRVITGERLLSADLPLEFSDRVRALGPRLDDFFRGILDQISTRIFGMSASELVRSQSLTLQPPTLSSIRNQGFGMLDMTHYYNTKDARDSLLVDVNVAEHIDPGLFSISLGQSVNGMQFYDPTTKEWIDAPTDPRFGVLFAGKAAQDATKSRVKAGVHRVTFADKPRFTIWYELCSEHQIDAEILKNGMKNAVSASFPEPIMHSPIAHWMLRPRDQFIKKYPKKSKPDVLDAEQHQDRFSFGPPPQRGLIESMFKRVKEKDGLIHVTVTLLTGRMVKVTNLKPTDKCSKLLRIVEQQYGIPSSKSGRMSLPGSLGMPDGRTIDWSKTLQEESIDNGDNIVMS
jgi:hypothetical protein